MNGEIFVAVLSLLGTVIGTVTGILTANKLVNYRIDRLEERLNEMDALDERLDKVELQQSIQATYIDTLRKEIDRNIDDIRKLKAND